MASAPVLYTPAVLGLATSLARFPITADLPWMGEARSASCGSALKLALALDAAGAIAGIGVSAHACAIGQAATAIFAEAAIGKNASDIAGAEQAIAVWLSASASAANVAEMPSWPGLSAIQAATAYPARHGAILLAWRAALSAIVKAEQADAIAAVVE